MIDAEGIRERGEPGALIAAIRSDEEEDSGGENTDLSRREPQANSTSPHIPRVVHRRGSQLNSVSRVSIVTVAAQSARRIVPARSISDEQ